MAYEEIHAPLLGVLQDQVQIENTLVAPPLLGTLNGFFSIDMGESPKFNLPVVRICY